MDIKTVSLNRLETDPKGTLTECADSGSVLVVELPGDRLVAIRSWEPTEHDDLVNELLASNPAFQRMVARSKASGRKPFPEGTTEKEIPLQ